MNEKNKKILIVEDDIVSAEYLKDMLNDEGYSIVTITAFAEDAITLANRYKPDLIIMDIMLSGKLTGCEAAIKIRQNQKECKIVFLTAYVEKEMIDYASLSQADGYLLKPYRDEEILATVSILLSREKPLIDQEYGIMQLEKGFSYDSTKQLLFKGREHIPLNKQKIKLIDLLVKNIDTTVSNEQICHTVWGESKSNSTLRSLIYRIKEVLKTELIHNSNGVGYVIRSDQLIKKWY